jgi:hypothetical protein
MTSKWIVRTGALLILLGYVLPSFTVSCSIMSYGETFSILDISGEAPLLFLIPLTAIIILVLAFLTARNRNLQVGFLWGQVAALVIGVGSILLTMAAIRSEIEQYGFGVAPEFGSFILVIGFLAVGVGLVMEWLGMRAGGPYQTYPVPMTEPAPQAWDLGNQPPQEWPDTVQSPWTEQVQTPWGEPAQPTWQDPGMSPTVEVQDEYVPSGVRLELAHGSYSDSVVPIYGTDFAIGRGSQNNLVLPDPMVSRLHARLRFAQGAWFLQDQGSKAGTFVNGVAVQAKRLTPGDQIIIGNSTYIFKE